MSDYKRLFIGARSNAVSEIIWNAWADNSHINNTNGVNGGAYPHASISNMWACGESPTQDLVDAFEMTNGAMPVTYNDATRNSHTVTPVAAELGYSEATGGHPYANRAHRFYFHSLYNTSMYDVLLRFTQSYL